MKGFKCIKTLVNDRDNICFIKGKIYPGMTGFCSNSVVMTSESGDDHTVSKDGWLQHFEEVKQTTNITITEEQAKQLPMDILKVVAPHLVDRRIDLREGPAIFISYSLDGKELILNASFDYTLKGHVLTPLPKL